ncbi:hypothetical protein [Roseiconus lacunae]|uniref:hypothetical protein n=1 Tax=Roseiconus lacunae TaxID=2605694 RepID=UPI0011F0D041|nr:hypothetical protein [Roseiconus lacunae]MCD0458297.1 hypothetical protein [Roseiconus lacunae]WRQ52205.1 hypothetical protein U8335_06590 [Stieleria sp. HD01]
MNQTSDSSCIDQRQRCSDYLLGEMGDDEASRFEADLTVDDTLRAALLAESNLICQVADQLTNETPCPTLPASPRPASVSLQPLAIIVAAIAAVVMIAAAIGWAPSPQNEDYEFQLATAWAERIETWQAPPLVVDQFNADLPVELVAATADDHELTGDEDALDWMVLAIEASLLEENRNEG